MGDLSRYVPEPSAFTVDDLKVMNATALGQLSAVLAGWPLVHVSTSAPDAEDRAKVAAVLDKAFDLFAAEHLDELRANLGRESIDLIRATGQQTGEIMSAMRDGYLALRGAPDEVGDALVESAEAQGHERASRLLRETAEAVKRDDVRDLFEAFLCTWAVLQRYREDPARVVPLAELREIGETLT